MQAYIEIIIDIKPFAQWLRELQGKLRPWHPGAYDRHYHITAVFFYDISTECLAEVTENMGEALHDAQPVSATFGKIDIFKDGSGHYIVYLDTIDDAIDSLIYKFRHVAECSGSNFRRDYIRHITLARIDSGMIEEEELRNIISSVMVPTFSTKITAIKLTNRDSRKEVAKWQLHEIPKLKKVVKNGRKKHDIDNL